MDPWNQKPVCYQYLLSGRTTIWQPCITGTLLPRAFLVWAIQQGCLVLDLRKRGKSPILRWRSSPCESVRSANKNKNDLGPREGVIVECHLNGLFHDLVTVILTSRMAVTEVEIPNQKSRHPFMVRDCLPQPLVVAKITTVNKLSWKWRRNVMTITKCRYLLLKCRCGSRPNVIKNLLELLMAIRDW